MKLLLIALLGYLIGSVPFALVIGKVFYHIDIREHGSKNLGGSNSGRVLGKKAGLAVMALDLLKVSFVVLLAILLDGSDLAMACGGLAAAIGHCYPIFANFKGGKAVANLYGFLFGLWVFAGYNPLVFFLPLIVFLLVLYVGKIVSLASMISSMAVALYVYLTVDSLPIVLALVAFSIFIIVRHSENLKRLLNRQENKISWM